MIFWYTVGTPEVAGLTTVQAMEIVRGCRGLNLVGTDVVEVSLTHIRMHTHTHAQAHTYTHTHTGEPAV